MLKPLFDKHAIESISLLCEFDGEIEKAGLDLIRDESKAFQRKLPYRRIKRKGNAAPQSHETSHSPEPIGYMFLQKDRKERDIEWFEVSGDKAIFSSKSYLSFESFLADCSVYMDTAFQAFFKTGIRPKRLVLRYRDIFSSEHINWEPYENLRADSRFLPHACIRKGDFWHIEAGFFGTEHDAINLSNYRVEHRIELHEDDEDREPEFFLQLTLLHMTELAEPSANPTFESIKDSVEFLRQQNRKLLHGIITEELASTIGLPTLDKEE